MWVESFYDLGFIELGFWNKEMHVIYVGLPS